MTLIVKSSTEDTISLRVWLMQRLNLHEGDEIKTIVEGQTLRLAPLEQSRFINQFTTGYGNYVEEWEELFGGLTLYELIDEIKQDRPQTLEETKE